MTTESIGTILTYEDWQRRQAEHHAEFDQVVQPHLVRRSHHIPNAVADFMFEYYGFRPSYLRKWSPGYGVLLEGATLEDFGAHDGFMQEAEGVRLSVDNCSDRFSDRTRWIRDMLVTTQTRTPLFGCFGLHEWAMLYRSTDPRHASLALRVTPDELAEVVESSKVSCTHFDAFRFFTPNAKPLNAKQLTRDDMNDSEQRGCLHANMDVYRWAFKRYPWIASELVLRAFQLALEIRHVDMAASPYDLASEGVVPIPIETPQGRLQYVEHQKYFAEKAFILRTELISSYSDLLEALYPSQESVAKAHLSS
ncbi:3-methyladenine DNA glycosylase [bacterium]|nr:3-methyladenine DNA glycosylase [bacterium]